jgi:hypothetical protein
MALCCVRNVLISLWLGVDVRSYCCSLCQREVQFFNQYDQLLTDYMADFELDLSAVRICPASSGYRHCVDPVHCSPSRRI